MDNIKKLIEKFYKECQHCWLIKSNVEQPGEKIVGSGNYFLGNSEALSVWLLLRKNFQEYILCFLVYALSKGCVVLSEMYELKKFVKNGKICIKNY